MIDFVKLCLLGLMSFFNGDGCYSQKLEQWVERGRRECHARRFKKAGALWMHVKWEISECGYIYTPCFNEKNRAAGLERAKSPVFRNHWNFVKEIALT